MPSKPFREKLYEVLKIILLSLLCGILTACLFLMLALLAFAMGA